MEFPVADVPFTLAPYMIAVGFAVGVCGGLWGMGGGWMVIPVLQAMGVAVPVAIGTSVAQILGNAVISSARHWGFGNVSLRITLILIPARILGIELGVRILEHLKGLGVDVTDRVIGTLYIGLLFALAAFIFREVYKAHRAAARMQPANPSESADEHDCVGSSLPERTQRLKLYPCIACKVSNISSISVWVIVLLGVIMGVSNGLLGVGGGLIGMPLMVYLIGCPTTVAVGTSMASAILPAIFATFRHAMHANVDLPLALCLLLGVAIGVQFGAFATRYVRGFVIRGLFAVMAFLTGLSVVINLVLGLQQLSLWVVVGALAATCAIIIYMLVAAVRAEAHTRSRNSP